VTDTQGRVTLWGIEVFLAAAEEGSITAAARRLGVSPSAISQQLSGLEASLGGAALLDRAARPMGVTPAGGMFRRHAQTILNAASEARAELAMADLSSLTTLRLGMIEDFDGNVTPHLLTQMAEELRGCQFLLETGASHRLLDQLEGRALDVVVAADMGAGFDGGDWMEAHPLLSEPFLAVAPRGQIDQHGDVAAQLLDMPLIQYTARHHMGRQIAAHLASQNLRLTHRFELDSYHAILAMVAGRAGWSILTPLGVMHAAPFLDAVDVLPVPFAPLSRRITLSARAGVLHDMPVRMAALLRPLLQARVVDPALARMPWLEKDLRVL